MPITADCRLRVVRGSGWADRFRAYEIFINGAHVGDIARDSALDVDVPCGPLTIEARLDWGRSPPLTLEVTPGKTIEVEVSNHWGALLALWGVTFGARSYLALNERSEQEQGR